MFAKDYSILYVSSVFVMVLVCFRRVSDIQNILEFHIRDYTSFYDIALFVLFDLCWYKPYYIISYGSNVLNLLYNWAICQSYQKIAENFYKLVNQFVSVSTSASIGYVSSLSNTFAKHGQSNHTFIKTKYHINHNVE